MSIKEVVKNTEGKFVDGDEVLDEIVFKLNTLEEIPDTNAYKITLTIVGEEEEKTFVIPPFAVPKLFQVLHTLREFCDVEYVNIPLVMRLKPVTLWSGSKGYAPVIAPANAELREKIMQNLICGDKWFCERFRQQGSDVVG